MPRRLLIVEYDGTDFAGWQWQPAARSVQGELERALGRVTGERVRPVGAGRTDAGVHALGQAAHVDLETALGDRELARALGAVLPPDVSIRSVTTVSPDFHARRDAQLKEYVYKILNRPERSALWRRWTWRVRAPLELESMRCAAALLCGQHDFSSFRGARGGAPGAQNPVRRLERLQIERQAEVVRITAAGRSFLRHMVRNLVGTLVEVGLGRCAADSMGELLGARDRARAGPTAPARGLCLVRVVYSPAALTPGSDSAN
jgi:tRNA pseudouridine38-40 synthase